MDRVGQFMGRYKNMGDALSKALKAYEDGEKKLQPGGQTYFRLVVSCRNWELSRVPRIPCLNWMMIQKPGRIRRD